eukprot:7151959-Pyramimonas_sp.AAC.1
MMHQSPLQRVERQGQLPNAHWSESRLTALEPKWLFTWHIHSGVRVQTVLRSDVSLHTVTTRKVHRCPQNNGLFCQPYARKTCTICKSARKLHLSREWLRRYSRFGCDVQNGLSEEGGA